MTVSSETKRNSYSGDGSTTTFTVGFYFLDQTHLAVYVDNVLKTLTTDYTVTGAGNPAGGSVIFGTAPAASTTVVILRDVPLTQGTDYIENDAFPADSHEEALDKLTMINQQLAEVFDRTVVASPSYEDDLTLPTPSAGKAITWNATEDGLENSTYDPDTQQAAAAASATAAATAQTAAETAQTAAETAQTAAETAKTNAETAETNAETAETNAAASAALAATNSVIPGILARPIFAYSDADQILIGAGAYHHAGTTSQIVQWSSQLTSAAISSPAADTWYYLYIDDSAIVTAGTNILTASEFVWSTTAPTYSETKHGWYNGLDRCVFAVLTDGSNNIKVFWHDGGDKVRWDKGELDLNDYDVDTTWYTVTLTAPGFCKRVETTFKGMYLGGSAVGLYIRPKGSSQGAPNYIVCYEMGSGETYPYAHLDAFTNGSQQIEVVHSSSTLETVTIWSTGWFFPAKM